VVQIGAHDQQPGQDGLPAEESGGTPQPVAAGDVEPSAPAAGAGTRSSLSPSGSVSPEGPVGPGTSPDVPATAPTVIAKSPSGSAFPPDVAGGAGDPARRYDPLTGPWPTFTRAGEGTSANVAMPAGEPVEDRGAASPAERKPASAAAPEREAGTAGTAEPEPPSALTAPLAAASSPWTAEPASPLGAVETALPAFSPRPVPSAAGEDPGPESGWVTPGVSAGITAPAGAGGGPAAPGSLAGGHAGPPGRRRIGTVLGIAAALIALVAGGGAYLYVQKSSPARAAGADQGTKSHKPAVATPEHVLSITPANGAKGVNGAGDIRVDFSAPLTATSPMPTLKPSIDGTWQRQGASAVFVPVRGYRPRTKVTVRVPAGNSGVRSAAGGALGARVSATFRTGKYRQARMEQLLAELGYLPLTWAPAVGSAPTLTDTHAQLSAAYAPPAGTYTWQPGYPQQLTRLWRPGKPSLILKGAVMAFEADHGLALDGVIGRQVWRAMFRAVAADQTNTHGYTYAVAREKLPETLTVWHNGQVIFHHLANTGIPVAPTAVGTDPVYLRYRHQIMRGRNPDGSKYADPVAWVAYFHYGEAIHYFPRYSYGSPQSLGCVELPYSPAKRIWPYLTFGTLVTVTGP
jgi:L,D-transpeptidase catalytic domain/Bacterial Ig-like domain